MDINSKWLKSILMGTVITTTFVSSFIGLGTQSAEAQETKIPTAAVAENEIEKEEIKKLKNECDQILTRIQEANKKGKPVLLLVGENHFSIQNTNMEIVLQIFLESKNTPLPTLYIELDQKTTDILMTEPIFTRNRVTSQITSPIAKGLGKDIVPVDLHVSEITKITTNIKKDRFKGQSDEITESDSNEIIKQTNEIRENYMIDKLCAHGKNGIFFTGAFHLKAFTENKKLNEKFTIIPILLPVSKNFAKNFEDKIRENWMFNDERVVKITDATHLYRPRYGELILSGFSPEKISMIAHALRPEPIPTQQKIGFLGVMDEIYGEEIKKRFMDDMKKNSQSLEEKYKQRRISERNDHPRRNSMPNNTYRNHQNQKKGYR